jgi:hypothetical protein
VRFWEPSRAEVVQRHNSQHADAVSAFHASAFGSVPTAEGHYFRAVKLSDNHWLFSETSIAGRDVRHQLQAKPSWGTIP